MFNRKPTRKILKSKNTTEKSTISKVSDLDQEIFDAMKSMKDKPGLKPHFIPISRTIHCFSESEYLEAKNNGAIDSRYQLNYTLDELESCIIETVNRGDRFAGEEHFRLFIFLRLATKLPLSVYSSIFWFFHDQHSGIIPYPHFIGTTDGSVKIEPYFQARIITERIDCCPLRQNDIDQVGDVRLELRC